ncbi:MAG TPA: NDP-sugar synthase [Candidatus Acidoferrum sp.]|nr:NDP-sugar synthase [Candidatus Acidoferrum sp.]
MTALTQAVILAGGQGTRLRPLTLARAKPVVPLLNRPFLAYQLSLLRQHGVTDVILSCSYRVEDVERALGDGRDLGVRLRYVVEKEPLGTGGGVRNAADLTSGSVFVLNGDVLCDVDLTAMRRFHESRGSRTTIYLAPVEDPRAYGLVETDARGRIERFREKPGPDETITTNLINAGVYLLDAALLRRMPPDRPVSIEREFFPVLIADGVPCFGWAPETYWRDIGNPAAYLAAQLDLLHERVKTPLAPPGARYQESWVGRGTDVPPGVRLIGPSLIGEDVVLGDGAQIGPLAVIGDGCAIAPNARIERSVLWERVHVGVHAVIEDSVIGADARIAGHAVVGPGAVLESGATVSA